MSNPVLQWLPEMRAASARYHVPVSVLAAQVHLESDGQEGLTSAVGAQGLTQFMPATAKTYGVNVAPGHAMSQIMGAAHYLHDLGFSNDPKHAIASYAAGPNNVAAGMGYASKLLGLASSQYAHLDNATANYNIAPTSPTKLVKPTTAGKAVMPTAGQDIDSMLLDSIASHQHDGSLLQDIMHRLDSGAYTVQGSTITPSVRSGPKGTAGPSVSMTDVTGRLAKMIEAAAAIDKHHYNYEWGGGHNPTHSPTHGFGHGSGPGVGYDCSGVVSKVLGIDARLASQFMSWGAPGKGKHVTIYASPTHVLMEINGRLFGTSSADNPGGGAGWIRAGVVNLSGFTVRHPKGM